MSSSASESERLSQSSDTTSLFMDVSSKSSSDLSLRQSIRLSSEKLSSWAGAIPSVSLSRYGVVITVGNYLDILCSLLRRGVRDVDKFFSHHGIR